MIKNLKNTAVSLALAFSCVTIISAEDLISEAGSLLLEQYVSVEDRGAFDSELLTEFAIVNNSEIYKIKSNTLSDVTASAMIWANFLDSLPAGSSKVDFLMTLTETQSGFLPDEPNPFKSALISLAKHCATEEVKDSIVITYLKDYEISNGCEKEYVVALGILADIGIGWAVEKLCSLTAFQTHEQQVCAKLAARGLLVSAYRDEDGQALEALRQYSSSHYELHMSGQ